MERRKSTNSDVSAMIRAIGSGQLLKMPILMIKTSWDNWMSNTSTWKEDNSGTKSRKCSLRQKEKKPFDYCRKINDVRVYCPPRVESSGSIVHR